MKKLHKSLTNKKLFGVCGGIAETYDFDPTLVRLIVVVLGIFTGGLPMLLAYVIAVIIMPPAPIE